MILTNLSHDDINYIAEAIINHPEFSGRLANRIMTRIDVDVEKERVKNLLRSDIDRDLKIREWKAIADDRLQEAIRQKIKTHEQNISDQIDQQVSKSSWMSTNKIEQEFERAVRILAEKKVAALISGVQRRIEVRVQRIIQNAISKVNVEFNLGDIFDPANDRNYDD